MLRHPSSTLQKRCRIENVEKKLLACSKRRKSVKNAGQVVFDCRNIELFVLQCHQRAHVVSRMSSDKLGRRMWKLFTSKRELRPLISHIMFKHCLEYFCLHSQQKQCYHYMQFLYGNFFSMHRIVRYRFSCPIVLRSQKENFKMA